MINADMRLYDYYLMGASNAYGQQTLPPSDAAPAGTVKMAIYSTTQATQDNIKYKDCTYIALTLDDVTDNFIIQYGTEKLKVLYVQQKGRYKQVFCKGV